MGLKRLICLFVLLAAGLTLVVWLELSLREPRYLGQPLSFWLSDKWASHTPMELAFIRDNKDAALRQMGPAAVPVLLRYLRAHDSPLKLRLLAVAEKQFHLQLHRFTPWQLHGIANDGLVALGPSARNAIPALLGIAQHSPDTDARLRASFVLNFLGPPTEHDFPALLRASACTNSPDTQLYAVQWLGRIHPDPGLAIPALLDRLNTAGDKIKTNALLALNQMPVEPQLARSVVPAMIGLLRDTNAPSSFPAAMACVTLGKYGTNAAPAIPALFEFVHDAPADGSAIRKFAVEAIRSIDPQTATTRAAELDAALHTQSATVPAGTR